MVTASECPAANSEQSIAGLQCVRFVRRASDDESERLQSSNWVILGKIFLD